MKNQSSKQNIYTYVIAEMSCAHEGDPNVAKNLTEIASEAKPDAIQLQIFSVDKLISPLASNYEFSKKLEISFSDWKCIISSIKRNKIDVWANVFDESSLEFVLSEGVYALKLHSSDISNPRMLDAVGISGKLISLGTGGSTIDEISKALSHLNKRGTKEIILMHGYQGYPTDIRDAKLGYIKTLQQLFGYPVGYQDHTDGGSDLALTLPLVAIGMGAQYIEKHFTDDRSKLGIDFEAALDPGDLKKFVAMIRSINPALGGEKIDIMSEAESNYRQIMKKKIIAGRNLKKGERLQFDDLLFLRSDSGLSSSEYQRVIGKYCLRDIGKYKPIHDFDISISSRE